MILFFDNILIYRKSWETFINYLRVVFTLLQQYCFLVRESKCAFGLEELVYLSHIISTEGVKPDPDKIRIVVKRPEPINVRQTRAFPGLTGYYRKFVAQYAQVETPLTNLSWKEGFKWSEEAREAFNQLKTTLTTAPMLAFPDFTIPFVVETDECDVGIGARGSNSTGAFDFLF